MERGRDMRAARGFDRGRTERWFIAAPPLSLLVLGACASAGTSEPVEVPSSLAPVVEAPPVELPTAPSSGGEVGTTPAPAAVSDVATWLEERLGQDPHFGDLALDRHSGGLVVTWYGEGSEEALAEAARLFPDVPVRLQLIDVLPGDMWELASRVLAEQVDAGVGSVEIKLESGGLLVRVHEDRLSESMDALAERLSEHYGLPVSVEGGAPVAMSAIEPD